METTLEHLNTAVRHIAALNMELALRSVHGFLKEGSLSAYADEVERIEEDYHRMVDYINLGYNDPQRDSVYLGLLQRLYRTVSNMCMTSLIASAPPFAEASRRASYHHLTNEQIGSMLENFVTDVALLELDEENTRRLKGHAIYSRHNELMQSLFAQIMTSMQWSDSDASFMQETLLSPTVDTIDAQLIISAIMLGCMNCFDPRKFTVLINVYTHVTDEHLRQRALVGWVFALAGSPASEDFGLVLFPECEQLVQRVCADSRMAREIVDLQKQVIFCMNAEKDNDRIQKDIMPTLLKNNNLNITRFGIVEKDEDPMQDVLNPEASEKAMEDMEASFRKMIDMQKSGADIYFGGFSQMKRFTFFSSIANWFYPFFIDHADISYIVDKIGNNNFMKVLLDNGPFCDSDKYSFVLAISSIIDKLPENMREMIGNSDALGPAVSDFDKANPAYIRRMYLQDLFRFFRLFAQRDYMTKAFSSPNHIFVADAIFRQEELDKYMAELGSFMFKRKDYDSLGSLLRRYHNDDDVNILMVEGLYYLNNMRMGEAMDIFDRILELQPDNERATALLAKACLACGESAEAEMHYEKLYMLHPENTGYALNYCVALIDCEKFDDAVTLLYRLDYENPENIAIKRVLAWGLMGQGKIEQADKEYSKLLENIRPMANDYLNAGYCRWFHGDITGAVSLFKNYIKAVGKSVTPDNTPLSIEDVFINDRPMLERNGITPVSVSLMLALVAKEGTDSFGVFGES